MLEKLEIFEYAFDKDFDTKLPEKLSYRLRKGFLIENILESGTITTLLFAFLIFGHFKRGWYVIMDENLGLFIFLILISVFALFVFLRNIRKFILRKTVYLEFSPQGVYLRRFRKYGKIDWKYVEGMEVKEISADEIIYSLYVDFKEQYYEKFGRQYFAINLNHLNINMDLLKKQINTVASKYISDN